jgi:hypothetical protein
LWWYISVIPATKEAEAERRIGNSRPIRAKLARLYLKNKMQNKGAGDVGLVLEHLPRMIKDQEFNPQCHQKQPIFCIPYYVIIIPTELQLEFCDAV